MKRFTKVEQMRLGRWLREHKAIVVASAGGGALILLTACKMLKRNDSETSLDLANEIKGADEEIFTRIAPAIEEALINKNIDAYHFERTYDKLGKKLNIDVN